MKVRVTDRLCGHQFAIGEVVEFSHNEDSSQWFTNGKDMWCLDEEEYEVLSEHQKAMYSINDQIAALKERLKSLKEEEAEIQHEINDLLKNFE